MNTQQKNLYQIGVVSLKLGCIGFGGFAGMVSLIENEYVTKKQWITRDHYLDVVGTANIIPGPNSVEIIMHCARVKGGKAGLIIGGIMYILPAMLICLLWAFLYNKYGHLPSVEPFIYRIRPATTAIIAMAVLRLSKGVFKQAPFVILSLIVLFGSLVGLNDVALLFGAGILGAIHLNRKTLYSFFRFHSCLLITQQAGSLPFSLRSGHTVWKRVGVVCLYG